MPKVNCAVINCLNSTYKLQRQKQEICYEHNDFDSSCKREDCVHCIPPFKLYCFRSILRNAELRNKWIRALKRQNKDKTEWRPSESDKVCSISFVGSAYKANSVPTLKLVSAIFHQIFIFSSNDRSSKTMKMVFYFIEKALFVLEIFKFL